MGKKKEKKGTSKKGQSKPKAEKKQPADDKQKAPKKIEAVQRKALVDVGGRNVEVTIKMFALSEDTKEKLELTGADVPEFATRKEAQAYINARRAELRGTATPKKIERTIKRYERVVSWIEKDKEALADGHPCRDSYDLMLSAANDIVEKLRTEAEGKEADAA